MTACSIVAYRAGRRSTYSYTVPGDGDTPWPGPDAKDGNYHVRNPGPRDIAREMLEYPPTFTITVVLVLWVGTGVGSLSVPLLSLGAGVQVGERVGRMVIVEVGVASWSREQALGW